MANLAVPNERSPESIRRAILALNRAVEDLETALTNITIIQANLNAAVTDTGTASNAGKLLKLDASGLLDRTNIENVLEIE